MPGDSARPGRTGVRSVTIRWAQRGMPRKLRTLQQLNRIRVSFSSSTAMPGLQTRTCSSRSGICQPVADSAATAQLGKSLRAPPNVFLLCRGSRSASEPATAAANCYRSYRLASPLNDFLISWTAVNNTKRPRNSHAIVG